MNKVLLTFDGINASKGASEFAGWLSGLSAPMLISGSFGRSLF